MGTNGLLLKFMVGKQSRMRFLKQPGEIVRLASLIGQNEPSRLKLIEKNTNTFLNQQLRQDIHELNFAPLHGELRKI